LIFCRYLSFFKTWFKLGSVHYERLVSFARLTLVSISSSIFQNLNVEVEYIYVCVWVGGFIQCINRKKAIASHEWWQGRKELYKQLLATSTILFYHYINLSPFLLHGSNFYFNLLQKKLMLKAKPILEETIMRLYRDFSPNCMKVANLGCSVGPNALLVISNIIDIVNTACTSLNREPPKFQFYLNDLFGNGFNTIFESLPNFYTRLVEDKGHKFGPCFVNATPGSFYGRLFPSNSINLFHSSYSLHWLSQVK